MSYLVEIVNGRKLPSADVNGLSDPFVIVKWGNDKSFRTTTQHKTLNPDWNERVLVTSSAIELEVWDQDTLSSNDFLGKARVALMGVAGPKDKPAELSVPLDNESFRHDKDRGSILIRVSTIA
eukprot:m51a1_g8284 putative pleckstrin domain-containing protein (123) ;mRNA; f:104088-104730